MGEGIEIGESHSDDESSSNDDEKPQVTFCKDNKNGSGPVCT
jgi:hypothetical protein